MLDARSSPRHATSWTRDSKLVHLAETMSTMLDVALKKAGIPTVRWSDQAGQYYARIGYRRSKSGVRQRAFFYLGVHLKTAIGKAASHKAAWTDIRRKGGSTAVWPLGAAIAPSQAMAKLSLAEIQAEIDDYHTRADEDALESGVEQQT